MSFKKPKVVAAPVAAAPAAPAAPARAPAPAPGAASAATQSVTNLLAPKRQRTGRGSTVLTRNTDYGTTQRRTILGSPLL